MIIIIITIIVTTSSRSDSSKSSSSIYGFQKNKQTRNIQGSCILFFTISRPTLFLPLGAKHTMWGAVTHSDPDLEHDSDAKQRLPCQWYHCGVEVLFHKKSQGSWFFKWEQQRKLKTIDKSTLLFVWMWLYELQLLPCGSDARKSLFFLFLRITTTVACNMDLTKYPMDKQTCTLQLESCKDFFLNFTL